MNTRKQAIEAIQDCFSKRRERNNADEAALQSTLYEQIGRQQTELNWLKKMWPWGEPRK